jgi:hypothetical protein
MTASIWKRALVLAALTLGGCATLQEVAGTVATNSAGNAASNAAAPSYPPPAPAAEPAAASTSPTPPPSAGAGGGPASAWASPAFAPGMVMMAFRPMGMPLGGPDLKPGEYVRLGFGDGANRDRPAFFERARLADDGGNTSWRVKFGAASGESVTIEATFSADGRVVRVREKAPGEASPRDLPTDNFMGVAAMQRQQMTPATMGATEAGTESVTVPAGTFQAHHFVLSRGSASVEWWVSEAVPGGLVKLSVQDGSANRTGLLQLDAYGQNATSEL